MGPKNGMMVKCYTNPKRTLILKERVLSKLSPEL